jgi:hypothetical protein
LEEVVLRSQSMEEGLVFVKMGGFAP